MCKYNYIYIEEIKIIILVIQNSPNLVQVYIDLPFCLINFHHSETRDNNYSNNTNINYYSNNINYSRLVAI